MQDDTRNNQSQKQILAEDSGREGTLRAWDFAVDIQNRPYEVESNWWTRFSDYRFRQWREELDVLTEEQGISLLDICRYLNVTYRKGIGFYDKLPKKRETYIGIGMALKQPLETINQWILRYGMKRKLYVKNLAEDLPWMYLINSNYWDRRSDRNYYREYEVCRTTAHQTYLKGWEEEITENQTTIDVETDLQAVRYDEQFEGFRQFVLTNMNAFKSAYARPRAMLDACLRRITAAGSRADSPDAASTLNALRGYLDDSMINYLSGSIDTINVIDLKSGERTLRIKQIPKNKRTHISLALALGMSRAEIDRYLTMMGFARLDAVDVEEGLLLNALSLWEECHPLPELLRSASSSAHPDAPLTNQEVAEAAQQMLQLRQDLEEMYRGWNRKFPYLK